MATDDSLGHVAIDGKRLHGSQHENSPGVHMLNAFSSKLQAAVGSLTVPPDSGEVIEALELIKNLPLEGAVITGDAEVQTVQRSQDAGQPLSGGHLQDAPAAFRALETGDGWRVCLMGAV